MNIIEAVKAAKEGKKIRRASWWHHLVEKDFTSLHSEEKYYEMHEDDFFADDWEIVESNFSKDSLIELRETISNSDIFKGIMSHKKYLWILDLLDQEINKSK